MSNKLIILFMQLFIILFEPWILLNIEFESLSHILHLKFPFSHLCPHVSVLFRYAFEGSPITFIWVNVVFNLFLFHFYKFFESFNLSSISISFFSSLRDVLLQFFLSTLEFLILLLDLLLYVCFLLPEHWNSVLAANEHILLLLHSLFHLCNLSSHFINLFIFICQLLSQCL